MWRKPVLKMTLTTGSLMMALVACSPVGPEFKSPDIDLPGNFVAGSGGKTSARQAMWWADLNDRLLNQLVSRGLANNLDIKMALERVKQSTAVMGTTGLASQFNGGLSGESTHAQRAGVPVRTTTHTGTLNANYVFDLFGKTRRGVEQAQANLKASEFDVGTVQLAIISNIVGAYLDARYFQEALALNRQSITSRRKTMSLVKAQLQFGSASDLDLARAQSELQSAIAITPNLDSGFDASVIRIALALGEPAASLLKTMQRGARQPLPRRSGSIGVPANLLHNRPDIRALEQRFAAAVAGVGIATADLYPSLELNGVVIESSGTSWSFGPKITLPIFSRARLSAQKKIAISTATNAELEWRKGVLEAVSKVQLAQNSYNANQRQVSAMRAVVATNDKILALSRTNYESGAISLIDLLDAQRANTNTCLNLASAVQALSVAWAELQIAAGYGWKLP